MVQWGGWLVEQGVAVMVLMLLLSNPLVFYEGQLGDEIVYTYRQLGNETNIRSRRLEGGIEKRGMNGTYPNGETCV